ncbi:Gfo/Idh/MocA family protein, partial [Actinomyces oris]
MLEASRELRVGVVGIGARCYLAALADSSPVSARLVVAADTAPDAVERARRLLPEGVAVVADHRDLLGFGIDAVVLTTPDDTHEELACFFLEAGVPVYLEKPLAITIEAADHILETA